MSVQFLFQWLVLDFGTRPALLVKLLVNIHSPDNKFKNIKRAEEKENIWDNDKVRIETLDIANPMKAYIKQSFNFKIAGAFKPNLSRDNYLANMLVAIKSEALARRIKTRRIFKLPVLKVEQSGEKFIVELGFEGVEEILMTILSFREMIKCVRIGLSEKVKKITIYEALIRDVDINFMKIEISKHFWNIFLKNNNVKKIEFVELQFQLDLTVFKMINICLKDFKTFRMDFIFPNSCDFTEKISSETDKDLLAKLSDEQKEIYQYCRKYFDEIVPPLVVYGPFGTGKSYTIASISLALINSDTKSKILIASKNAR